MFLFLNLSLIACLGTEAGGRLMEGRWGGGGGGYKRRTVEGVSQSGKRGRDITTKGSAGKHWFWGNIIFFKSEHDCIFKISASGNGATFFSFLSPPPLQCPGQLL